MFAPARRGWDGKEKDTLVNIRDNKQFVVNIVSENIVEQMVMCATDFDPTVDEFQRHLQTELEKSEEITDAVERSRRRIQIESAIQEAIAFRYKWKELKDAGQDPLELQKAVRLVANLDIAQSKIAQQGDSVCKYCDSMLEGDLEFCSACGKFQ